MCALVLMSFTFLRHYQFRDENKIDVYFELLYCPVVRVSRAVTLKTDLWFLLNEFI